MISTRSPAGCSKSESYESEPLRQEGQSLSGCRAVTGSQVVQSQMIRPLRVTFKSISGPARTGPFKFHGSEPESPRLRCSESRIIRFKSSNRDSELGSDHRITAASQAVPSQYHHAGRRMAARAPGHVEQVWLTSDWRSPPTRTVGPPAAARRPRPGPAHAGPCAASMRVFKFICIFLAVPATAYTGYRNL
jgi:hypothetical protein